MSNMKDNKVHIRKDDTVIVISGNSKGKKGKVLQVSPKEGKIIIEGVNMVSKHVKPKKQGEAGGIVQAEGAMYACKAMPFCQKCGKGVRIKKEIRNDKKIRCCAKCGNEI